MGKSTKDGKGSTPTPASPYQGRIMDHSRAPHHSGAISGAESRSRSNPLCGDQVTVYFAGTPRAIAPVFESQGCALCRASASILMDQVHGLTVGKALLLTRKFIRTFETGPIPDEEPEDMAALRDMRRFASRAKCVLLPWETMDDLLASSPGGPPDPTRTKEEWA